MPLKINKHKKVQVVNKWSSKAQKRTTVNWSNYQWEIQCFALRENRLFELLGFLALFLLRDHPFVSLGEGGAKINFKIIPSFRVKRNKLSVILLNLMLLSFSKNCICILTYLACIVVIYMFPKMFSGRVISWESVQKTTLTDFPDIYWFTPTWALRVIRVGSFWRSLGWLPVVPVCLLQEPLKACIALSYDAVHIIDQV